ncbi:Cnl2/NKP2 family protein-domain-containing protein [Achaetomium macrosporum]|uniref:Cnl2/NKP2 family protein-domain-containing protein n=1 Tax=Achaetomium macrosporum TaxID=79813 RepID=A0AAN7CHY1_9PEZI|nr:Cnl2/NKP2 family protein-domain-containing protein [Achaetomium macrosporum]
MAPTEQAILSNYLLVPARLPAIISLQEFIALFPRQLQSSPRIRSLYRDLQSQRNVVVDAVAEQIEQEVKQGKAMRRAVIRSKREAEAQEQDDEVEIERMLGSWSAPQNARHSLASILPDMEGAIGALEAELQLLEEEEAALLSSVRGTVGAMSDLRYGRLANSQLPDQVLDGLANLQEICRGKS